MKHTVPALAALLSVLMPLAASADDILSACKRKYPTVTTFAPVTGVTEAGNAYFLTANGKRFKAVFREENFASFLTAIGGGKITLYADAKGNLYGPNISGNDSRVNAHDRACIRL